MTSFEFIFLKQPEKLVGVTLILNTVSVECDFDMLARNLAFEADHTTQQLASHSGNSSFEKFEAFYSPQ